LHDIKIQKEIREKISWKIIWKGKERRRQWI